MAENRFFAIVTVIMVSACGDSGAIAGREIPADTPLVIEAVSKMHEENPDTLKYDNVAVKAYLIEGQDQDCVWLIHEPIVAFNDAEFVYCADKDGSKITRL